MNTFALNPNLYDVVFLSYDEPNADENYEHLLSIKPKAKRVHGVKGSDAAHKACAELAKTDRVIIVDGDNKIATNFFVHNVYTKPHLDWSDKVFSWSSLNVINGNCYGNGGVKCWPVEKILSMKTHEVSEDKSVSLDFDLDSYLQLNRYGSHTVINSSPKQAWRAGFRDAAKLFLSGDCNFDDIDWRNMDRLYSWMHVGADVENGLWACYGARLGCYLISRGYNPEAVRDFDKLDKILETYYKVANKDLVKACNDLTTLLNHKYVKNVFTVEESIAYKQNIKPPVRSPEEFVAGSKPPEYDIVFISYDEPNADENYQKLVNRFPRAKRLHGVKGIHQAHKLAATYCSTDYFWVVDGDAEIDDNFNFDYVVPFFDLARVRVWRCKNPINDLVYGYGGVKLLPRCLVNKMDTNTTDMTSSISKHYEPVNELSNITRFNIDPYITWRSAFRECVKLSSQTIQGQISQETEERLHIWCTVGMDKPFGRYAIAGALQGRAYGYDNKDNPDMLRKVNDYNWLREFYERTVSL